MPHPDELAETTTVYKQRQLTGIINPRRACAARVTVLGLCVCVCVCLCVCVSVCLLLNISLFKRLFVPQTILTFSAANEGRKFQAIFSENASLRS